jgi:hypothetical protein
MELINGFMGSSFSAFAVDIIVHDIFVGAAKVEEDAVVAVWVIYFL